MKYYTHHHVVTFGETNLVSNVYYVNYLHWQGHCREHFIREYAPDVLDELRRGLALFTVKCSCEYLGIITAFDELEIRMFLKELTQNQVEMSFEYWKMNAQKPELVGRGIQRIACMRQDKGNYLPTPVPKRLASALMDYL